MFRISPATANGVRGLFGCGAYLIFDLTSAELIRGGGGLNRVNTVIYFSLQKRGLIGEAEGGLLEKLQYG